MGGPQVPLGSGVKDMAISDFAWAPFSDLADVVRVEWARTS
jgi:hypothetical protein